MINGQELIKLINKSDLVKEYCGIPKEWKNIVKLTYNSVHRLVGFDGNKPVIQARFYGTRKFKESVTTNMLLNMKREGVFEHLDRRFGQAVDLSYLNSEVRQVVSKHAGTQEFLATDSFKPDDHIESTSVDGYVGRINGAGEDFSVIRSGAGTNYNDDASPFQFCQISTDGLTDKFDRFFRGIFLFDTSSIGAGQQVSSSDFKLYVTSVENDLGGSMGVVSSNPASNTGLATSDYGNLGTTRFASDIANSSLSTSAYNTWSLNASGIAAVDMTGISKFGTRLAADIDNSEPSWTANYDDNIQGNYADSGSNEPTLDVTYTEASSDTGNMFLLF